MVSQQGGGGRGLGNYRSPKGTPTYQQLRAATPFTGTLQKPAAGANAAGDGSYLGNFKAIMDGLAKTMAGAGGSSSAAAIPPDVASMLGLDAGTMAHNEFAPQYELLDQMRKQAEAKYTQAGNDVGGMYDALSKNIKGQEGGIKSQYAASGKGIGDAYNQAINNTNSAFTNTRNEVADLAKRLGIQAAVPSAMEDGVRQQTMLDGLLNANSANQQGVNQLLGNNDVAYNRESANNASLAGVNARSDFKGRLLEALAGYDNKELDLSGQEAAATNKYDLSIKDMMRQSQEARDKLAQDDELKKAQLMLGQGRLKLDSDKLAWQQGQPAKGSDKAGAYETLATLANGLYGNSYSAGNATKAIQDTFVQGKEGRDLKWTDANEFVRDVLARNPNAQHTGGDAPRLAQLALAFYEKIAGGANKTYGYNTGM